MNTTQARAIQTLATDTLRKAFAADPLLSHLTISTDGGRIGANSLSLKFAFVDSMNAAAIMPTNFDNRTIAQGYAAPGTVVLCQGEKYMIVRAKRLKYSATQLSTGKTYLIRFAACVAV